MSCPNSPMVEVGMQDGEEVANALRLLAFAASLSILSRFDRDFVKSSPLLYFNWFSNLLYPSVQLIMSLMVLNCWSGNNVKPFIYFLKFVEIMAASLIPLSSLSIFINLWRVIKNFKDKESVMAVIPNKPTIIASLVLSFALSLASSVYWNILLMTGGYFWTWSTGDPSEGRWINISFTLIGTVTAPIMIALSLHLLLFMREAFLRCVKATPVLLTYTVLCMVATVVTTFSGIGSIVDEVLQTDASRKLVLISWCVRYIQIVLDVCVLEWSVKRKESLAREGMALQSQALVSKTQSKPPTKFAFGGIKKEGFGKGSVVPETPEA